MVIPASAYQDRLDVSQLRGPLLDDYYGSAIQRRDVMAVAEEIKRRHLAKLPSDTGNLKSTARVTAHRSKAHRDRRYEAEYSIGGPRADYIVPLEDKHHWLDETLREMGFYTGDIVNGPTGKIPAEEKRPAPAKRTAPVVNETYAQELRERQAGARELRYIAGGNAEVSAGEVAAAQRVLNEREAGVAAARGDVSSRKIRAGMYEVSGGGRSFTVEQRRDIPGQPWRASDPESFHDPHMGDFRTKAQAMDALRATIENQGNDQ